MDTIPSRVRVQDFVIFAGVALLGLVAVIVYIFTRSPPKPQKKPIARWNEPPAHKENGDLGEMAKHGSLHQYLLHLHDNGRTPVTSFWWENIHVVSSCTAKAFRDSVQLVDRPRELFKGFEPLIGSHSIQYANGEDWKQRQKCLYHTLKGNDLLSYFPCFVKIAQETEEQWCNFAASDRVPLMKELFPMTIKGITRACLGDIFEEQSELDVLANSYHGCWDELEDRILKGLPADEERERKFQQNVATIRGIVRRIVQARREGKGEQDIPFIDALLTEYQAKEYENQIIDDTLSFMVGGFHTSGNLMVWMLWFLANHPSVQERLVRELREEVGGECGQRLQKYASRKDTCMRQVQDESLRVSTLAPWAGRVGDKEETLDGYSIPPQTPIIHALGVALWSEKEWTEVHSFDPDRMPKDGKRGHNFCPFGVHSKRKCPGYEFSYFETAVFLSVLLARFKITPVEGQDVKMVHGLVTTPSQELFVNISARE